MIEQYTTFNLMKLRNCFIGSVHVQLRGINQRVFNYNQLCQFALCFSWFLTFQNEDGINIFKLRQLQSNYAKLLKNYCSKLCTNKFIFMFHMLYILIEFKSSLSIKACIKNNNDFFIETNLLRSLCGVMPNQAKVGVPQALRLLFL